MQFINNLKEVRLRFFILLLALLFTNCLRTLTCTEPEVSINFDPEESVAGISVRFSTFGVKYRANDYPHTLQCKDLSEIDHKQATWISRWNSSGTLSLENSKYHVEDTSVVSITGKQLLKKNTVLELNLYPKVLTGETFLSLKKNGFTAKFRLVVDAGYIDRIEVVRDTLGP